MVIAESCFFNERGCCRSTSRFLKIRDQASVVRVVATVAVVVAAVGVVVTAAVVAAVTVAVVAAVAVVVVVASDKL